MKCGYDEHRLGVYLEKKQVPTRGSNQFLVEKQACRTSRDRVEEARVEEGWQGTVVTEARAMAAKVQGDQET